MAKESGEAYELAKAYVQIVPSMKGAKNTISEEMGIAGNEAGEKAGAGIGEGLSRAAGVVAKAASALVAGAMTGAAAIAKSAVEAYANYEQLVGGVETLFGTGGKNLDEYAASIGKTVEEAMDEYAQLRVAQYDVMQNAAQAYKTAGMSANDYMQTVTGFAASLKQGLGGDVVAAAKYADQALIDMADNANKMGTSMEAIQYAYAGFAKDNYTMLDNLKLGYGGTKTEMVRLINDANKLDSTILGAGKTIENLDGISFSQIIQSIHAIQENLGITGTTAKEAMTTITGSLSSAKAAWQNVLVGIADDTQDFDRLVDGLVETLVGYVDDSGQRTGGVINNLLPRIKTAIDGVGALLRSALPEIAAYVPGIVGDLLPVLINAADDMLTQLFNAIPGLLQTLVNALPDLGGMVLSGLGSLGRMAEQLLPVLESAAKTIIAQAVGIAPQIAKGIAKAIPGTVTMLSGMISEMIPEITELIMNVVTAITDALPLITEQIPEIIETIAHLIPEMINALVALITEALPVVVESGVQLFTALIAALPEVIPVIAKAIPQIVAALQTVIIESLPVIVQAGITLLTSLVGALPLIIEGILPAVPQIVSAIVNLVIECIPLLIQAGIDLLMALVGALPQIIQGILPAVPKIISAIIGAIVDNIPLLIHAGIDLLVALVGALPEIIDAIVPAIPEIVEGLINAIAENLPEIMEQGVKLFVSLVERLPEIIEKILEAVGKIITDIFDYITGDGVNDLMDAGKNLLEGLWKGISGAAEWLWNKITGWLNSIWDGIKEFFGVHSPSTEMAWIGEMLDEGLAGGILDEADTVSKAMDEITEMTVGQLESDMAVNAALGVSSDAQATSQLQQLIDIVEALGRKIEAMQIVLDSGQLVGGLSSKMDVALGDNSAMVGRRVALA